MGQDDWTDPAALNHLWDMVTAHPSQTGAGLSADLLRNAAFNFPSYGMQLSCTVPHLLSIVKSMSKAINPIKIMA